MSSNRTGGNGEQESFDERSCKKKADNLTVIMEVKGREHNERDLSSLRGRA